METSEEIKIKCFHCGEECDDESIHIQEKIFCCEGCKLVFELLDKNNMCTYYDFNNNPGIAQKIKAREGKFSFLEDPEIKNKFIHFTDGKQSHVRFYLPQMHCSSCIWLLENLHRIEPGILSSQVNFPRKEVTIIFQNGNASLKEVAELLTRIGYEPHISLNDVENKISKKIDRTRIFKLGIAGFCFGNIMMLCLPEYFSSGEYFVKGLHNYFVWISLILSLPVFFYCASEFYFTAWKGIKQKTLNIDAPIALAIIITFSRSVYEVVSGTGTGYLDSMSGIVFFMLLGRLFQDRTWQSLSFDRDYSSFFPVAVTVLKNGKEIIVPISKLKKGDRILIRSNEIIPADSILFLGKANIDYSFVTGESIPVEKSIGEIIYAGGKQTGASLELEVIQEVSQSYLTQLWNKQELKEQTQKNRSFIHALSRNFTWILFSIAFSSAVYWYFHDPSKILNTVTATLIVACPCALLLSATFTNGNVIRVLGKNKFYLKNPSVIESIASIDSIVFDKTGTITKSGRMKLNYEGEILNEEEKKILRNMCRHSNHPLSRALAFELGDGEQVRVERFHEFPGQGVEGFCYGQKIKYGSASFVGAERSDDHAETKIFIDINDHTKGSYTVKTQFRNNIKAVMKALRKKYNISLLSGDNSSERVPLLTIFGNGTEMHFNNSPEEKLNFVSGLKFNGHKVMMVGDGLNDAGALLKSDAGIAITDDANNFTPACDAIMEGSSMEKLPEMIKYCRIAEQIIVSSFVISILYNFIGLWFSVQGDLSPVIAAILMPLSSITIVLFTTGASSLAAKILKL